MNACPTTGRTALCSLRRIRPGALPAVTRRGWRIFKPPPVCTNTLITNSFSSLPSVRRPRPARVTRSGKIPCAAMCAGAAHYADLFGWRELYGLLLVQPPHNTERMRELKQPSVAKKELKVLIHSDHSDRGRFLKVVDRKSSCVYNKMENVPPVASES